MPSSRASSSPAPTAASRSAADLRGKRVGIPGRYGSSWIMLQALLASAGLTPDDVDIQLYPDFGQATALREGQVDAATGFANNEPVQLALAGIETNVLRVDETTPLPGQGLTVGTSTLASKKAALEAFVAATLRAMEEITANPQLGLDDSIARCRTWQRTARLNWRSSTRPSPSGTAHTLTSTAWAPSTRTPGASRSSS